MIHTVSEAIAWRLLELCSQRQLTLNQLADKSGLTPSTIYSIFTPTPNGPTLSTLTSLTAALDSSLPEFFDSHIFDYSPLCDCLFI